MARGDDKPGFFSRIVGAAIGGGGTWLALELVSWQPEVPVQAGISGAMALAGFALGPKVWEAVASLV